MLSRIFLEILWSTAEAVLRQSFFSIIKKLKDSMVYCGSGTETLFFFAINNNFDSMVYCGSGTETSLFDFLSYEKNDSMVYCGSGTETIWHNFMI